MPAISFFIGWISIHGSLQASKSEGDKVVKKPQQIPVKNLCRFCVNKDGENHV